MHARASRTALQGPSASQQLLLLPGAAACSGGGTPRGGAGAVAVCEQAGRGGASGGGECEVAEEEAGVGEGGEAGGAELDEAGFQVVAELMAPGRPAGTATSALRQLAALLVGPLPRPATAPWDLQRSPIAPTPPPPLAQVPLTS